MSRSYRLVTRKSFLAAAAITALSLCVAACSANSADEVAVRNLVGTTMEEISQRTGSGLAFEFMNDYTREELTAYGIDAEAFAASAVERMTYELGEVHTDSEKATVSVDITNVSLGAAMQRAAERFETYSQSEEAQTAYDEGAESALMDILFTYLEEEIAAGELQTVSSEIICTKVDDSWQINPADNEAFMAALYGLNA